MKKNIFIKFEKKCRQNGRSMIEILGVLAIIAVLSSAGLAGYSKAMQQHKINTFMNQLSLMQSSLSSKLQNVKIEERLTNESLISLGVFGDFEVHPEAEECELWSKTSNGKVLSSIKQCILVEVEKSNNDVDYVLDINLGTGKFAEKLCLYLIKNYSWENLGGIDTTVGFVKGAMEDMAYVADMCHRCANDDDEACWFDTYWRF